MANSSKKAEVIPVEKEKQTSRFSPANLLTPFEEMEQWVEDMFSKNWLRQRRNEWPFSAHLPSSFNVDMPKVDVIDRDNEVFIKAELPDIDKKRHRGNDERQYDNYQGHIKKRREGGERRILSL